MANGHNRNVQNSVGPTLREARNRRKIGLSEVEAATKIRLRYLRAMENEEWDLLPGGSYTRSFIRTYASFLGLDGERLADEYRRGSEPAPGEPAPVSPRRPRRRPRFSSRALTAIVTLCMLAILIAVGLSSGGGGGGANQQRHRARPSVRPPALKPASQRQRGVTLRLVATAEVWVCLLDGSGARLIDGQILSAGSRVGPYHSGSFTVSLGNGEVSMKINGHKASTEATSGPIGYSIDPRGRLVVLPASQRPTCT